MSAGLKLEQQEGDLPASWELVAIDDVCTLGGGKTPRKSNDKYWNGSIPWVSPKDFDGVTLDETEDKLTEYGVSENSINLYDAGDIAMVVRSGVLRHSLPTAQLESEMAVNQDVKVLQPDFTKITSDYLLNILLYEADRFRASCVKTGTTVESVETAFLKAYKLPLPPLPEQNRIADILSTVDEQIQRTDEIIQKTKELKHGLMQELLTTGLGSRELKKAEIGPLPIEIAAEWSMEYFDDVIELNPRDNIPSKDTFPFLPMDAVNEELREIDYWEERNADDCTSIRFQPGDTVYAKITPCTENGKIAYVEGMDGLAFGSTEFFVFRARKNQMVPKYVYYLSNHPQFRAVTISLMEGSTGRQRVPTDVFQNNLRVPVPPINEQNMIVEILDNIGDKIREEQQQKKHLKELKRGLMQDLLTGTKRVASAVAE